MKKNFEHKISRVLPESIAEELEIEPGDVLLEMCIRDSPYPVRDTEQKVLRKLLAISNKA